MSKENPEFTAAELSIVAIHLAAQSGVRPQECFSTAHSLLRDAVTFIADPRGDNSHEHDAEKMLGGWDQRHSFAEIVADGGAMAAHWKSRQAIEQALKRWVSKNRIPADRVARIMASRTVNSFDIAEFRLLLDAEKADRSAPRRRK
jgi:hypothetical protein